MTCCTEKVKCYTTFGVGIFLIVLGIILIPVWPVIFNTILTNELTLNEDSMVYEIWQEPPVPIYLEFHMFNWTNAEESAGKWNVKPSLEELGPYVFYEHHMRVNKTWNANNTITFRQIRDWRFEPSMSNGNLDDLITTINPVYLTVSYIVRYKHYLVQRAVDLLMREQQETLLSTKTVREFLFDGYDDKILALMQKLNVTGLNIPFDRFGWFYTRNGSADYDGVFTMNTGADDLKKLGLLTQWNGEAQTKYFPSYCGLVNGSEGELYPPIGEAQTVTIFVSDICSSINLRYNGTAERLGIEGRRYIGADDVFDDGSTYPDQACFTIGDASPPGVRNISSCKFGAPAFISYPHFYLADESYREAVDGMKPNRTLHELHLALEPSTGIPLEVRAQLQLNLLVQPIRGITGLSNVTEFYLPVFWFNQKAALTDEYADMLRLVIVAPNIGTYTGYGILALGLLIVFIGGIVTYKRGWKDSEREALISEESFK